VKLTEACTIHLFFVQKWYKKTTAIC